MAASFLKKWEVLVPLFLLGVSIAMAVDEFQFGRTATSADATVRSWKSTRWFGYRGAAKADVDVGDQKNALKDRSIRTRYWLRPEAGDRLSVLYDLLSSEPARIDSVWRRYLPPMVLGLIAAGWLWELWFLRKRRAIPETNP